MPTSQPLNPPNEFPDIVGLQPVNPILASFRPFIPPRARLRELTPLPLVIGTLLGMVFGASSLYLVLKVGLTVSASIPVAVISITIFRVFSKLGLRAYQRTSRQSRRRRSSTCFGSADKSRVPEPTVEGSCVLSCAREFHSRE